MATENERSWLTTIGEKLVKIDARCGNVSIQMAEIPVLRDVFAELFRRVYEFL